MFVSTNSKCLNNETKRFPENIRRTFAVRVDLGHILSRCMPSCLKTSLTLRSLVLTAQSRCHECSPHFSLGWGNSSLYQKKQGGFLQPLVWLSYSWLGTLLELPAEVLSSVSHTSPLAPESCGKSFKLLSSGMEYILFHFK